MAQRRMFSPEIVNSDAFLEMPPSTQALYFQLGMKADDDGFVNPKMVMRMMGSVEDELRVLVGKRFVLPFENGVIVIKHWRVNNLVRKDWYKPTVYLEEKSQLFIKDNGSYTLDREQGQPLVNEPLTQVRLGKVSIGNKNTEDEVHKKRLGKDSVNNPDWLDTEAWEAWEKHRREIGKTLTPSTRKLQLKLLEDNKADQKDIINNSITNGWTGLFPLKKGKEAKVPRVFK